MGYLHFLLDKMGLEEMGLDEMGWHLPGWYKHPANHYPTCISTCILYSCAAEYV